MSRESTTRLLIILLVLATAAVAVAAVWAPVVARNWVPTVEITDPVIDAARTAPSDAVLEEIYGFDLLPLGLDRQQLISVADGILQGRLELPDRPASPIGLPFSPDDLDGVPASIQLWFAGYGVPDILLRAYVETGYEPYFTLARDEILAWDRYEQTAWQPRGYLWNDHATAARVRVLGEFWRLYRQRPDYSPEVGRVVLEQAARYRALLADPADSPSRPTTASCRTWGCSSWLRHFRASPTPSDPSSWRRTASTSSSPSWSRTMAWSARTRRATRPSTSTCWP